MNRKEFIKACGRMIILGGMAASAGYLVANKRVDTTCSVSPACKKCDRFSGCELPQAKEVKDGKE